MSTTITCRLCPWRATRSSNRRAVAAHRVHVVDSHPVTTPLPARPTTKAGPPQPLPWRDPQPRTLQRQRDALEDLLLTPAQTIEETKECTKE
jgi:hypothetical protein